MGHPGGHRFYIGLYSDRLAPVLKTVFHQCVISYTCSQTNSDGSGASLVFGKMKKKLLSETTMPIA